MKEEALIELRTAEKIQVKGNNQEDFYIKKTIADILFSENRFGEAEEAYKACHRH